MFKNIHQISILNFQENATEKEFWKSASIWRSYV